MTYGAQRLGFQAPRGLIVLLLILGTLVGAAVWIGPFRPIPAELRVAVDGTRGTAPVALANAGTSEDPRFPLMLTLSNHGGRSARPVRVSLNVPAVFQVRSTGVQLERESVPGNPLVRYELPVTLQRLAPGAPPEPLAGGDTLWLEPLLNDYYCTTLSDSIPEFVPSPALTAASLAEVQIYYSVAETGYEGRQGGLLDLRLDPAALHYTPAPMPPTFPTQVREPEIARPELGQLRQVGTRTADCGEPQQPLELYTVTWETAAGGRFLVVYLNGAPRKQLFDLDRDSIIELEMWDPDADGRFEARRAARYAIPTFLLPERRPEVATAAATVAGGEDWERLFADTALGPFRFAPDSLAPPAVAAMVVIDSIWLRRFNDVAAGPFRFSDNPPPLRAKPAPRPRPRGPVPLGTPIPYQRPPGGGGS